MVNTARTLASVLILVLAPALPASANDEYDPAASTARDWSFGPYLRYVVVPAFMLELFLDVAPTSSHPAYGVTARYRGKSDGPMFDVGLGYASYAFEGAFRSKGGVPNDTEWVESDLGLVHLTGSISWEAPLSQRFAFEYGVGLDFGIVTGQFRRTEAFVDGSGRFGKCAAIQAQPGSLCQPPLTGGFSDPAAVTGEQYNIVDERVPSVMALPMLPRLGMRYTPLPDLAIRLEGAYGIAQVWFGLSAAYAPAL